MDRLGNQKDQAHTMLVRHHECTQEMEFRHLELIQKMRLDHQKTQQSTEWTNQMEYNKRVELDLKRRHMMEQKQQPKTLKVSKSFQTIHKHWNCFFFLFNLIFKERENVLYHGIKTPYAYDFPLCFPH